MNSAEEKQINKSFKKIVDVLNDHQEIMQDQKDMIDKQHRIMMNMQDDMKCMQDNIEEIQILLNLS